MVCDVIGMVERKASKLTAWSIEGKVNLSVQLLAFITGSGVRAGCAGVQVLTQQF